MVFVLITAGGTALNLGCSGRRGHLVPARLGAALRRRVSLVGRPVPPPAAGVDRRGPPARRRVDPRAAGAAERIRLRERARIAGEMHDSLGHDLSLIALRAAALEVAADLDDRHRVAAGSCGQRLRRHRATARDHRGPPRGGGRVAASERETVADLVDGAREAGMAVRMDVAPAVAELPAMTGHAAHRIVREALTNAARYAPGAPVDVHLTSDGDRVEVTVVNAAPPAGPLPPRRRRAVGCSLSPSGSASRVGRSTPAIAPPVVSRSARCCRSPRRRRRRSGRRRRPGRHPGRRAERPGGAADGCRAAVARRPAAGSAQSAGRAAGAGRLHPGALVRLLPGGDRRDGAGPGHLRPAARRRGPVGAGRAARRQLERPRRPAASTTPTATSLAEPTWRLCFTDGRLVSKEWIV
ncbi:histidine kinase [Micromonospora sp. M12]